jgi:GNAT superfamily N-acetyltransferase
MSSSPYILRGATSGDAGLLAALAARLFEQPFGAANDPDDMRFYLARAFSPETQRAELADPDRAVWIAEDSASVPIGFAQLKRGKSGPGVTDSQPAEVERIYADQAWHGRGVGAALMQACVDQARTWHCGVIWLGVWERNPRAIAFYAKAGFTAVGRQTFLLGNDVQHDLVMARAIDSTGGLFATSSL